VKRIFRYDLDIEDEQLVDMPRSPQILSVAPHRFSPDRAEIWALVDDQQPEVPVRFRVFGTGHPADAAAGCAFIGTVPIHGGSLIFHVFVDRTDLRAHGY
jgi:hypothetical protein